MNRLKSTLFRIPPIVQCGRAILRKPTTKVTAQEIHTPQFRTLLDNMTKSMRHAKGIGLAAPQVNSNLSVFIVEVNAEYVSSVPPALRTEAGIRPYPLTVFINPVLSVTKASKNMTLLEGCLSVSGTASASVSACNN
ncbi:polypeptide deformylase [Sphaeroforma arctica JP610]|uniref:Peptide deformylase n=1 Tax=Sphaeroforma arctica JP610 TaxID=667725 RepID=A0A0L0G5G5_9EUKA|nr:polypeptide deformylase [Sphaeroforma arctica JP610]KNC84169.1 polypeptide deformylase [Sphaeroforma arctica JP610]|eukprot:XP_014158071.1 polypeptide deformylase [Sphaeroforma arctica JP610]